MGGGLLRHRAVRGQAEGEAVAAVERVARGPFLIGGELQVAPQGVQRPGHVLDELREQVGGTADGVGLGKVGVLVFPAEFVEPGDLRGFHAGELVLGGRGRRGGVVGAEVFEAVDREAVKARGGGGGEGCADSEKLALALAFGEGALGPGDDGVERGDEFGAGGFLLAGAGLFPGAGGFDLSDQLVGQFDAGFQRGLFLRRPLASGDAGLEFVVIAGLGAQGGEVHGVGDLAADIRGFCALFGVFGGGGTEGAG